MISVLPCIITNILKICFLLYPLDRSPAARAAVRELSLNTAARAAGNSELFFFSYVCDLFLFVSVSVLDTKDLILFCFFICLVDYDGRCRQDHIHCI